MAALGRKKEKSEEQLQAAAAKKRAPKAKKAGGGGKASAPKKSGGKRFVFIIGDEGGILVFMQGAKVIRRLFAPSAQQSHTGAMLELLSSNPGAPISVLVDVLDQQYVPQTFPPVSAMSVGGLVKRRLSRDFQPDDLKNSLPLGRDKTGRKEWRFLLISLSKTPLISEWIELLVNLPNEFKGIYLVPVEAIGYIAQLNKQLGGAAPNPWQMFISHNKVSGFRQVVVHGGKLVFTRVSQAIDDAIPAVIAGNIEQEVINTLEYLKRLDFKDEGNLDITVIISQDVGESLDLKRFGFSRINVLTPLAVSEVMGLEQAALSADRFGDVVMAAAFAVSKKRTLRFSTAYMDKIAQLYQARVGLKLVMGLAVAACVILSLMSASNIVKSYGIIAQAEESNAKMRPELEKMEKRVGGLNQNVAFKSAVVTASDAYMKNLPLPEEMLEKLVPLVSAESRISGIAWQHHDALIKKEAGSAAAQGVELKVSVDFTNAASDVEKLSAVAATMLQSLQTAFQDYDVVAEPYPWGGGDNQKLTLDLNASAVPADKRVASYTIRGPKKGKAP